MGDLSMDNKDDVRHKNEWVEENRVNYTGNR